MHRNKHFGQAVDTSCLLQLALQGVDAHQPSAGIDIDKIDLSAAVTTAVGGGYKGDWGCPKAIACAKPQRKASDVECTGGAVYSDPMASSHVPG